ncbi:MAG: hypothetical protein ACRD24_08270, partial [Terriglobales bacterium]
TGQVEAKTPQPAPSATPGGQTPGKPNSEEPKKEGSKPGRLRQADPPPKQIDPPPPDKRPKVRG